MKSRLSRPGPVVLAVGLALLAAAPASAANSRGARAADAVSPAVSSVGPNIIGFESDATGDQPQPFTSHDNPSVHFVATLGSGLILDDFGDLSNGRGLAVLDDTPSALVIILDVPTMRLSILFGNDRPGFALPGDRATLTVYRKGERMARRHVTMNVNDAADQTVEYRGRAAIDRATFVYDRAGTPIQLGEVVDDITLAQNCTIEGNRRANRLVGTSKANGICGLGGADLLFGRGGNDVLVGGNGNDRVIGEMGNDLIVGGGGDDILNSMDGVDGNDTNYGGPGNDTCLVDAGDQTYSCDTEIAN